jgi:hypothetical protein
MNAAMWLKRLPKPEELEKLFLKGEELVELALLLRDEDDPSVRILWRMQGQLSIIIDALRFVRTKLEEKANEPESGKQSKEEIQATIDYLGHRIFELEEQLRELYADESSKARGG